MTLRVLRRGADAPPGRPWASRLEAGEVAAVALREGEILAFCWLSRRPVWVGEIGLEVLPRDGEAYVYDAYTEPAHRGQALFPALLRIVLAEAAASGADRVLIFVLDDNRASIRAIERVGFAMLARVCRVDVGRRSFLLRWPWRARHHRVRFRPRAGGPHGR